MAEKEDRPGGSLGKVLAVIGAVTALIVAMTGLLEAIGAIDLKFLHKEPAGQGAPPAQAAAQPSPATPPPVAGDCRTYDPKTDRPDPQGAARLCRPGQLAYVKWIDQAEYPGHDPRTGVLPNDLANRAMSLASIDASGTARWAELNLVKAAGGQSYWPKPGGAAWMEIAIASPHIVAGRVGTLLRRQDPEQQCAAGAPRRLLEAFIPTDLSPSQIETGNVAMCYRWASFDCAEKEPAALQAEPAPFDVCVGRIVKTAADR